MGKIFVIQSLNGHLSALINTGHLTNFSPVPARRLAITAVADMIFLPQVNELI